MSGSSSDVDRTYQRTTDIEELRDNDGVVYATRNYASIPRYKLAPLDKSSFVTSTHTHLFFEPNTHAHPRPLQQNI